MTLCKECEGAGNRAKITVTSCRACDGRGVSNETERPGLTVADRLRACRMKAGMSARHVSQKIGCGHAYIISIEAGHRGLNIDRLVMLADVYGVSTDYLVAGR